MTNRPQARELSKNGNSHVTKSRRRSRHHADVRDEFNSGAIDKIKREIGLLYTIPATFIGDIYLDLGRIVNPQRSKRALPQSMQKGSILRIFSTIGMNFVLNLKHIRDQITNDLSQDKS